MYWIWLCFGEWAMIKYDPLEEYGWNRENVQKSLSRSYTILLPRKMCKQINESAFLFDLSRFGEMRILANAISMEYS